MFKKLLLLSLLALPVVTPVDASCSGGCCGGSCGVRRAPVRRKVVRNRCIKCKRMFTGNGNICRTCSR